MSERNVPLSAQDWMGCQHPREECVYIGSSVWCPQCGALCYWRLPREPRDKSMSDEPVASEEAVVTLLDELCKTAEKAARDILCRNDTPGSAFYNAGPPGRSETATAIAQAISMSVPSLLEIVRMTDFSDVISKKEESP